MLISCVRSLSANRRSLSMLILSAICISFGCDRTKEPDSLASGDQEILSPSITSDLEGKSMGDGSSLSKEIATVPNLPADKPNADKPDPELEPLAPPPGKLAIGDVNPGLHIAKWAKGEPVNAPLKDKVHVVEFWATWCGPCRVGMPHISELQFEYEDDVTFIGVTREDEATVSKFLNSRSPDGRTWDEVIGYRLAIDDRGWMNTAYMRAAGQGGIPCAYVVGRDGIVEWIGHPAQIDEPLKKIVEGNWDRDAAIAEQKKQQRLKEASAELSRLARAGQWDSVLELLDELEQEVGKSSGLTRYRLQILDSAGRNEEASAVRAEMVQDAWDDASALNEIAWKAATASEATDLDLALKAAERASSIRNDEDPMILDTLARCYYELDQIDQAIKFQQLAVDNGDDNKTISTTLEKYLAEKATTEKAAVKEAATEEEKPEEAAPEVAEGEKASD